MHVVGHVLSVLVRLVEQGREIHRSTKEVSAAKDRRFWLYRK
jgi:hypothetical protein